MTRFQARCLGLGERSIRVVNLQNPTQGVLHETYTRCVGQRWTRGQVHRARESDPETSDSKDWESVRKTPRDL